MLGGFVMSLNRFVVLPILATLSYGSTQSWAESILSPDLASFAVLGAAGVTNVPTSTIGGNLGSAPNGSVGGGYVFTAGSLQANTAIAQQAQLDLDQAKIDLGLLGPGLTIGADLTGTIFPGIYTVLAGPTNLSGTLVLDGQGNANALWVFHFESTLITSTTSNVSVINTGSGAGIYWNVGSAATLNGFTFAGNVLAHDLISSDGNLTVACGRLLSAETQVTLIMDSISIGCDDGSGGEGSDGFSGGLDVTTGPSGETVVTVLPFAPVDDGSGTVGIPEPGTIGAFGFGMTGLFLLFRRKSGPPARHGSAA